MQWCKTNIYYAHGFCGSGNHAKYRRDAWSLLHSVAARTQAPWQYLLCLCLLTCSPQHSHFGIAGLLTCSLWTPQPCVLSQKDAGGRCTASLLGFELWVKQWYFRFILSGEAVTKVYPGSRERDQDCSLIEECQFHNLRKANGAGYILGWSPLEKYNLPQYQYLGQCSFCMTLYREVPISSIY